MDPILGGLITGGASLLGNMFSSTTAANQSAQNTQQQIAAQESMLQQSEGFNNSEMMQAEAFNNSQAAVQRQFQEQMSNTAYSRAVTNMKQAGLNPMMMFGSGAAASTPMGSSPSVGAASVGTPGVPMPQNTSPWAGLSRLGDAAGEAVNSAISIKSFDKMTDEIANLRAENAKIQAGTAALQGSAQQSWMASRLSDTLNRIQQMSIPGKEVEKTGAEDVLRTFGSSATPGQLPAWMRETMNSVAFAAKQLGGAASGAKNVLGLIPEVDLMSPLLGH